MRKIEIILVGYYGLWQFVHLVFNLIFWFVAPSLAFSLLGGTMTPEQFKAVAASGFIDLVIAHPTAFLFVWAYFKQKPWANAIGYISLTVALYSAYLVTYLHFTYGTYVFKLIDFLISWGTFAPVIILFIYMIRGDIKERAFNKR